MLSRGLQVSGLEKVSKMMNCNIILTQHVYIASCWLLHIFMQLCNAFFLNKFFVKQFTTGNDSSYLSEILISDTHLVIVTDTEEQNSERCKN
jgi:hypothetical protein